ncbi:MAG: N(4)-(beta-N-acetylglucosaminyl)-L-asparaginase [Fimbriimonadales bacterium]|nr:N(4)-(beta-N-acetylglucosaminyl)-L-asparaginase [Fimbriimonadales bacterium]
MQTLFAATWWFGQIGVEAAWQRWQESRESDSAIRLLDAVIEGAAAVERDPQVMSVGYGGLPNRDGEVELDAAVMEGARLRAGAVAGVRGIAPVIHLAREVMLRTPHLMLVGEGATRFALQQGYEPQQLLTAESLRRWQEWRKQRTAPKEVSTVRSDDPDDVRVSKQWHAQQPDESHDTVGVLGWNAGHVVVACTTSGLAWKLPGRVGDSPIVGAGLYADNEAGAAVCTGVGEEIWRFALASRVVEAMRAGYSAQQACQRGVDFMLRRLPDVAAHQCAVMAVQANGDFGLAATQPEKFEAFVCRDGAIERVQPGGS